MSQTADIYRAPTGAFGARGEVLGHGKLVARSVPFALKPISGREAEQARSHYTYAAYQLELRREPSWNLHLGDCYLHWRDRDRVLHIGYADDSDNLNTVLLCGADMTEVPSGNG